MTRLRSSTRPWRLLWLAPVLALAALSIVATGGGGGGGGDGVDVGEDLPLTILPNYNFFLANLPDDSLLSASVGPFVTVTADIDGLFAGTIDLNTDAANMVTLVAYSVRPGVRVDLTVADSRTPLFDGTLAVTVTEEIDAMFGEVPGSGAFDVVTAAGTVTVSILAGGVQLSLDGAEPVSYDTWDEFTDQFDKELQDTWQRHAAAAGGMLEFMIDLFFNVADILDELEAVTVNNPIVAACDMLPNDPGQQVMMQGDTSITWLGSGELSVGDDFNWQFNDCWSADDEALFRGAIALEDYAEVIDFNTNTLFDIGFGGLSGEPGGVIHNLMIFETEEDQGFVMLLPENIITIDGGFALIIQAP